MSTETVRTEAVRFERVYRATVQEIWDLWTTKEGFESWFGPEGCRVEVSRIEPRLGGALHYAMIAETPEMVASAKRLGLPAVNHTRGRFSRFEPHRRIELTHLIDAFRDLGPFEQIIEVELVPQGERVRMVVTVHPMPTAELSKISADVFTSQLTTLDKRFQR